MKYWTLEEDEKLKKLVNEGLTPIRMAKDLDRSAVAINNRIKKLGEVDWDLTAVKRINLWTKEDEQKLKTLIDEGMGIIKIAKELGRSTTATMARIRKCEEAGWDFSVDKTNHLKSWTLEEDERLKTLFDEGIAPVEIAKEFKRSIGAINSRIKKWEEVAWDIQVPRNRVNLWTIEEDLKLQTLVDKGLPNSDIGKELERTTGAIKARIKKWDLEGWNI